MTTTLLNLIQRIYPSGNAERILIAGLDYTGKTTLLYYMKLGEIVTTIPSIGFNVETIDVATSSNKRLKLEAWDVGSGCGGSSHMIRMLRFYLAGAKALIWMVDSADRERLIESVEALKYVTVDIDAEPEMANRHIPILILANKSELSNTVPLDEIRVAFSKHLSGRIFSVYSISLKIVPPSGVTEAFDWLALALDISKTAKKGDGPTPSVTQAPVKNLREPSMLAKKLEDWLQRTATDSAPEEFMAQFNMYQLPSWDHYTHIRLAYLILVAHGRQKGKDLLFTGLSNYISNSTQTNGRAFHFTMTYFWLQIVHFGIRNLPEGITATPPTGGSPYPSSEDFFRFLFVNPHVVDGSLWSEYYQKETIMSPEAKERMVLPDKKPLPNLVVRDAITSVGAK